MKYLLAILLVAVCHLARGEKPVLTADSSIPIPKLSFDAKGELQITASADSSMSDFDFLVGKWKMHNRRLNKRLEGCQEWTEFESADENSKILNGTADMDTYSTTAMPGQEGKLFEGVTLRLFNPKTRLWSLYCRQQCRRPGPAGGRFVRESCRALFHPGYFPGKTDHYDVSLGCPR